MNENVDDLFLKTGTNWFDQNVGIFSNLHYNIDEEKGYLKPSIINKKKWLHRCNSNCDQISMGNRNNCYDYCQEQLDKTIQSNQYIMDSCKTPNHNCCKKKAQDNDLGYLFCMNYTDLYPYNRRRQKTQFYYLLIIISIFIICLSIVFLIFSLYIK